MIKWFRRKKDEEAPEGSEAPPPLDEKTSAPAAGAAEQADGGGAPAQAATATEAPAETVAEESARAEGAPEDTASGGAAAADAAAADAAAAESPKKGFFARLRDRLGKTKTALVDRVRSVIRLHGKVDEELLDAIEEILIQSDVGVQTTTKIVERMRKEGRKAASEGPEALLALFKDSIEQILHANNRAIDFGAARPMIVLVVGVNGTGKTTTIGKMAQTLVRDGKRVMMVAADTFRAAAVEQLAVWAGRTGAA
ncbi:MAG: signal recognition particle receptor subunit alpha, partial [bacterium]|nr:signal recognition particle receptor subunit alpha [bacterium]